MKNVLFVGDINVDLLMGGLQSLPVVDKEITCASFDLAVGSSAVICACAYASLGGKAAFMGLAGKDDYGNFMVDAMRGFGMDISRVRRTEQVRTGVTVNLIHQSTRTQITYPGTISAFDGSDIGAGELQGVDHVHFAGPYQQTNFRPYITRLLKLAAASNITTSLDPQWDASGNWEFMDQWLELLTYCFVNDGEAMSITKTASAQAAGEALRGRTRCPLLKAGPAGSMAFADGEWQIIPAKKVNVVDTTGAGDCFDAGFLYATLEKNLPLLEAMRVGNACGSRSVMFPGGVAHRSTYNDLVEFNKNFGV